MKHVMSCYGLRRGSDLVNAVTMLLEDDNYIYPTSENVSICRLSVPGFYSCGTIGCSSLLKAVSSTCYLGNSQRFIF